MKVAESNKQITNPKFYNKGFSKKFLDFKYFGKETENPNGFEGRSLLNLGQNPVFLSTFYLNICSDCQLSNGHKI